MRLKKDYFSKPKGTIVDVVLKDKYYQIIDKKERMAFAYLDEKQKAEYIETVINKK